MQPPPPTGTTTLSVECGRDQMGPRSRYDPDQAVSASTDSEPTALGVPIGELAHREIRGPLTVDGQCEIGQRVLAMIVGTALADDDLRPEPGDRGRHDRVEPSQPQRITGAGQDREVDRGAFGGARPHLARPTGVGPQRRGVLVDGDRHHTRVAEKRVLDAVSVVGVDVDVGDPVEAVVQQPGNGDRGIVVHTEPGCPVRHRVVHSAADAHRAAGAAGRDLLGGGERTTGEDGAGLVHAREDRVVVGTESVPRLQLRGQRRVGAVAGEFDRVDVGGGVDAEQIGVGGGVGADHLRRVDQTQSVGERHRQIEPGGVHRMLRTPAVAEIVRTPDHDAIRSGGCCAPPGT